MRFLLGFVSRRTAGNLKGWNTVLVMVQILTKLLIRYKTNCTFAV